MADKNASDKVVVSEPVKSEHGGQVHLIGLARAAARGGAAGDMMGNILAKQALEADGLVADGGSADGTTRTGEPQPDDIRSDEPDAPIETGRVVTETARGEETTPPEAAKDATHTPAPEPETAPKGKKGK